MSPLKRYPHDHPRTGRSAAPPGARSLLVATDGAPSSRAAIKKGLFLARELGARITFVSVYRPPWAALGEPFYQRSLTRRLAISRKALEEAKTIAEDFGTDAEYEIVEGNPAKAIVAMAAARNADLVVVGSRDFANPTLRSSVSRSLVGQSDRAVLVAKDSRDSSRRSTAVQGMARSSAQTCSPRSTFRDVHRALSR